MEISMEMKRTFPRTIFEFYKLFLIIPLQIFHKILSSCSSTIPQIVSIKKVEKRVYKVKALGNGVHLAF